MSIPMIQLREIRDKLLAESDWVVFKEREEGGSVSNFADWKKYRQELRDLPSTASSKFINQKITAGSPPVDMSLITFPKKPD